MTAHDDRARVEQPAQAAREIPADELAGYEMRVSDLQRRARSVGGRLEFTVEMDPAAQTYTENPEDRTMPETASPVAPAAVDWHLWETKPGDVDLETEEALRPGWSIIGTVRDGDLEDVLVHLDVTFAVGEDGSLVGQQEQVARRLHALLVQDEARRG